MIESTQTIYALSSGRLPAAIAVLRISGPHAAQALMRLIGKMPQPRRGMLANLKASDGEIIDEALVLWFPAPNSETGEDVVELQPHGSRAVIARLFAELSQIEGFRAAEPGEFSRRAFLNGKLDLTAAEGLLDLINADTEMQRKLGLRHLKGFLGTRAEHWRRAIIEASALIEAGIDFADEGDVPDDLMGPAFVRIMQLRDEIAEALSQHAPVERLREGMVVAIAGPPNAGKSTLLNRLARREAAIVSPYAGTTRDVIEVHLDLGGYPLMLLDMAGIRETDDPIEQEGVKRARARAEDADLILWLEPVSPAGMDAGEGAPAAEAGAGRSHAFKAGRDVWRVMTKIDTKTDLADAAGSVTDAGLAKDSSGERVHRISALSGSGMDALVASLGKKAADFFEGVESSLITRQRHRDLLILARDGLDRALAQKASGEEIVAEELRAASVALGRLTGRVDVEDILDVVFRDFCIGK